MIGSLVLVSEQLLVEIGDVAKQKTGYVSWSSDEVEYRVIVSYC